MMAALLLSLHWLAGLVVLAEALNKLERCDPAARGITPRARASEALKAAAWCALAFGAASALATPLLAAMGVSTGLLIIDVGLGVPGLDEVAVLAGFALLVVRTRVKEG